MFYLKSYKTAYTYLLNLIFMLYFFYKHIYLQN